MTEDPLLTGREVAQRLGIRPGTWRSLVSLGDAPRADDRDEGRPVGMRLPRWRWSKVAAWHKARPGQGRRTDLVKKGEGN